MAKKKTPKKPVTEQKQPAFKFTVNGIKELAQKIKEENKGKDSAR